MTQDAAADVHALVNDAILGDITSLKSVSLRGGAKAPSGNLNTVNKKRKKQKSCYFYSNFFVTLDNLMPIKSIWNLNSF